MRILYFDPIGGISGDMILAALIDLGVNVDHLKRTLRFVKGSRIKIGRAVRQGVSARTVQFKTTRPIREQQFLPLINKSKLPPRIKSRAMAIIERIFAVEKKIHRARHLHLHELADADTILDIVGVLVAIDFLKVDKVFSLPVKVGSGLVKTREGPMPAFNFATAELLKGFPIQFLPVNAELTTPTGAAIISSVATPSECITMSKVERIGLGAGSMDIEGHPNILRIFLGDSRDYLSDECTVIETNLDDMNPQDYEMLFDNLYSAGALEVFLTPIIMKRSRPGILLTVLCQQGLDRIVDVLFAHTTSIGFRIRSTRRLKFNRKIVSLTAPYGKIHVKVINYADKRKFSLEYRDLKRIAQAQGRPINEIRNELMQLFAKKYVEYIK